MNKKVSIIIPVYNGKNYILKLFDSIINQTYKNFEVVFVNDGSTDESLTILQELQKENEFVKVINQKNKGRSESRNVGVKNATGYYITFADQDDYYSNDYLEIMIKNIDKNDILLSGFNRVSDDKIIKKNIPKMVDWSYYKYCATWGKLYKKSFFEKNKLMFYDFNGEDIFLFFNAISLTKNKKIVSYSGYNNYINLNSITHTINSNKKTRSKMMDLLNKIENSDWCDKLDQDKLLDFYIKSIVLHLFTQRKVLNFHELCEEYNIYFDWLNKIYKTRNQKLKFFKEKGEEKFITFSINLFIIIGKLHLIKPFLFFFRILGSNLLKN